MGKEQQPFRRESIDDDLDQLLKHSFRGSNPDAQLISELHYIYKEDAASLSRVWQRLEHYSRQQHRSRHAARLQTLPQSQAVGWHILSSQKRNSGNRKSSVRQLSTVLVATIVSIFLVGSLLWIMRIAHITAPATNRIITGKTSITSHATFVSPKGLLSIRMIDRMHGWALTAHALLKTSDGGKNWQDVSPQGQTFSSDPQGEFLTARVAWLVWSLPPSTDYPNQPQTFTILHTSNGGTSWQTATISNARGKLTDPPRFLNARQGWLTTIEGEGMMHTTMNIYQTTDGGQTWSNVSGPVETVEALGDISFANTQLGWAGLEWPGNHPVIERTVNGGQSWHTQQLPNPSTTITIGNARTNAPVLLGANGLLPAHLSIGSLPQVCLTLYTTHDSGESWIAGTVANFDSTDVYAVDTQHVWAEETTSNTLHISSNGGKTWSQAIPTPQHFGALSFVDTQDGWAIDDAGQLSQTTDGGVHWQKL